VHSEYINTVHVMPELHFQDMTFHSKLGRLDPLSMLTLNVNAHTHVQKHTTECSIVILKLCIFKINKYVACLID